jgi:phosphatidylinositol dimannoside acyltransferase
MLRLALEIADRLVNLLPGPVVWALADMGGDAWRRFSPSRRRLVAANLARVCAATGRPATGPAFTALVRSAFRHHARYYIELLRAPHYSREEIDEIVSVPDWDIFDTALRGHGSVLVSWHVGNFEPFGIFLAVRGHRPLAPIEAIEPQALFQFLAERRGAGEVDLVRLEEARPALTRRLRQHGLVAIIGDRDLAGSGQVVSIFGHPTTFPAGPATLGVLHGAEVVAGRCLRVGPDRFHVDGEVVPRPATGDRRADIAALTGLLARRFETDVTAAPDQWWGAFQPFWPDLPGDAAPTHR